MYCHLRYLKEFHILYDSSLDQQKKCNSNNENFFSTRGAGAYKIKEFRELVQTCTVPRIKYRHKKMKVR